MTLVKNKKEEMNLTEGPFFQKLFIVAFPLIVTSVLQLLYSSADLIVCGQFGSLHAVAAISSTNGVTNLLINLFVGLAVGANVIFARCYGSGQQEEAKKVSDSAMIISVICGFIVGITGFIGARTFLIWMDTPEEILDLSTAYLKIFFIGTPFSMIYNFGSALLRALGETKRPLYFATIAGIVNVLLNLVFVIVFQMDVAGVALATIISQAITAVMMLVYLSRYKGFLSFSLKDVRIYKKASLDIIKVGLPSGVQSSIFSISNIIIQSSVNSLGAIVMDGSGASNSLESIVYMIMNGFATANIAFVSANYGRRNKDNIKKCIKAATILTVVSSLLSAGFFILLRYPLISLYLRYEEAKPFAFERMFVVLPFYFLCGIMDTFAYSLRGLGKSTTAMLGSILGVCGIRIVWIYTVFRSGLWHTITGVIISWPISWVFTMIIQAFFLFRTVKKIPDTSPDPVLE